MIRRIAFIDWLGRVRRQNFHEVEYPEPRRARRIRDKQRMKAHAHWVAKHIWDQEPEWRRLAEKLADHLAHCKKPCCNRRRHYEGPTMQERRQGESHATGYSPHTGE